MVHNLKVLITGGSFGLGNALLRELKEKSCKIINISRTKSTLAEKNLIADLNCLEDLYLKLNNLDLDQIYDLDLIILNAATIGEITKISNLSYEKFLSIINVNLISNKIILDTIFRKLSIDSKLQVIAISSSAAYKTISGISPYCISKASLNMLIESYSKEYKNHKFISICPGIINTKMQRTIQSMSLKEIEKIKTQDLPNASELAKKIVKNIPNFRLMKSGIFVKLKDF